MNRRLAFGRLAAGAAVPVVAVTTAAQSVVTSTGNAGARVGQVMLTAQGGSSFATVFNGRAWQPVVPNGLGWSQLLGKYSYEELGAIAVKAGTDWAWAADFVKKAVAG